MKKREIQLSTEVKQFIESNLSKGILIKDVCQKFAVNKNKLQKTFKLAFGQTLHAYIVSQKMQRAIFKLQNTDAPIKAIAHDLGYSSSSFNSKFKKIVGYSPERFREKYSSAKCI